MIDPNLNELHRKTSISPSGYPEMIFRFGDPVVINYHKDAANVAPRAMVAGQLSQSISLDFNSSLHSFCVKLMPDALRAIFSTGSTEFTDRGHDLDDVAFAILRALRPVVLQPQRQGKDGDH
ncbi:MAG: hypothetical protein P1P82_15570 [Bacteroidales bacterium]|nr:hypothetical protein [Bacteroidales bacterium]